MHFNQVFFEWEGNKPELCTGPITLHILLAISISVYCLLFQRQQPPFAVFLEQII